MRTKIKMLLSAILCFVFVFSFVACGDKGSAEKPDLDDHQQRTDHRDPAKSMCLNIPLIMPKPSR